jgi:aminoglycoside phosphotransferase (APT) family kinase protein
MAVFRPVLADVCRDVEAVFGPDVWLDPVEMRERLFSFLLRARVCPKGSQSPRSHIYLKVGKPPASEAARERSRLRITSDFTTMRRVFERMGHGSDFGAVRPIACYPDHLAIVTEQVDGETLLERIQHQLAWPRHGGRAGDLRPIVERAGRWIAAFQATVPPAEERPTEPIGPYVDARLRQLAQRAGASGQALRQRVMTHVEALAAETDRDPRAVSVHADLSPSNVLVSGSRVVVLDFAMTRLGHPLQDAARLFTQLDLLKVKPQFRAAAIDELQDALLRGFAPGLSRHDPAFRLQVLSQRVNHLASLSTRRYSWREAAYNWLVKRSHVRWIERELETAPQGRPAWE